MAEMVARLALDAPAGILVAPLKAVRGFMRRVIRAAQEARMREAERQIARYIESNGGFMTDNIERAIGKTGFRETF